MVRPRPGDPPRIERDDFPAPPYPYTDPERRRRWSESSKRIAQTESDAEDNKNDQSSDAVDAQNTFTTDDSKVKVWHLNLQVFEMLLGRCRLLTNVSNMFVQKSEAELSKIATGIGKVFLHNLKEREKMRQWKMSHLDPRNASRTPSANKVPSTLKPIKSNLLTITTTTIAKTLKTITQSFVLSQ